MPKLIRGAIYINYKKTVMHIYRDNKYLKSKEETQKKIILTKK